MSRKSPVSRKTPDHYARRAKTEHYPARSVYKLQEIHKKHNVLKPGNAVLDLGCFPGSWMMFAAETVDRGGKVTGIDLKKVATHMPAQVTALQEDIYEIDRDALAEALGPLDVVLSDMAPDTMGNKFTDAARSFHLAAAALDLALFLLKPGGHFVCKVFQGEDFQKFVNMVKAEFERHKVFKPETCRKDSKETYVIGFSKKESTHVGS